MRQVNIYTYATVKGPGKKSGSFTYLLEYQTGKGTATLTKHGSLEDVSDVQANLQVIIKALQRLKEKCKVTIYTECQAVKTGIEEWIPKWKSQEWTNAKGKEVANKKEWQEMAYLLGVHVILIKAEEQHSYRYWIKTETEKKEKERREQCMTNMENLTQPQS